MGASWGSKGGLSKGHYLTIGEWVSDFHPSEARIDTAAVWVRVPNMPTEYQNNLYFEESATP